MRETMQYFTARTPGSRVVETRTSVVWQYGKKGSVTDHSALQSKDLLIHLWAGPLLSAPAEVSVEHDCVCVRPTGLSNSAQLEKTLQKICCKEGEERPSAAWRHSRTCVTCIGDFFVRDEDLYTTVQRFFSNGQRKEGPAADKADKMEEQQDGAPGPGGRNRHVSWSAQRGALSEDETKKDEEPQSLDAHTLPLLPKRRPSLPDMDAFMTETLKRSVSATSGATEEDESREPATFLCTVGRKTTRANYYLTSTSDVAFLFAQLARGLREEREAADTTPTQQCSS